MSEQTKALNPLKKLEAEIASAKDVKGLLKIGVLSDRYIANFEAGTGRKDGKEMYEREAFAFIELANKNPAIFECDPFSVFAGFIKAGMTGLSFGSGKLSAIPKMMNGKKILTVEPDAHGKREMLERMPTIKKIDEGVVIFNKDAFVFDAKNKKVVKHEQAWPRPEASEANVVGAYCTVHFTDGHSEDVVVDLNELKKARAKSTNVSWVDGAKVKDGGQLWVQHYGEACKKTTYNRAFKVYYKQPSTAVIFKQFESKEEDEQVTTDVAHTTVSEEDVFPTATQEEAAQVVDAEVVEEAKTAPKEKKKKDKGEEPSFV